MREYAIRGVTVQFPYDAYSCQKDYFEKVIASLQEVSASKRRETTMEATKLLYFLVEERKCVTRKPYRHRKNSVPAMCHARLVGLTQGPVFVVVADSISYLLRREAYVARRELHKLLGANRVPESDINSSLFRQLDEAATRYPDKGKWSPFAF
jgi:hypothetical protein